MRVSVKIVHHVPVDVIVRIVGKITDHSLLAIGHVLVLEIDTDFLADA